MDEYIDDAKEWRRYADTDLITTKQALNCARQIKEFLQRIAPEIFVEI
ncbi:MAG: hypothetical protein LBN21_09350 [Treponema sp.]|jgi:hypothetical protein|nr:hypothetical protein [Treponema sp.]